MTVGRGGCSTSGCVDASGEGTSSALPLYEQQLNSHKAVCKAAAISVDPSSTLLKALKSIGAQGSCVFTLLQIHGGRPRSRVGEQNHAKSSIANVWLKDKIRAQCSVRSLPV